MQIFLIAGKSGSGKTHVAKLLKEYLEEKGQKALVTEYSKYLKLYAKEMLNWDEKQEEKPRDFLQEMGSYIRENLNMPNFFIERMLKDIEIYSHFMDTVIISDIRYPKEIECIKEKYPGSIAVLVEKNIPNEKLTIKQRNHLTEHALDNYTNFDYCINNDYNNDLQKEVVKIIKELEM